MGALSDHSYTNGGPPSNSQILGGNGQLNGAAESKILMLPGHEKLHNAGSATYDNSGYCLSCNKKAKNLCAKHWWKYTIISICILVICVTVVCYLAYVQTGVSQKESCLKDWVLWDKKCYRFSTRTDKWKQAFDFCSRLGSQLLVIKDETEKSFIQNAIREEYLFWVGLIFGSPQMQQIWADDAQFNQSLSEVFISEGSMNCGVIQADQLRSEMCSDKFKWICERDAAVL